MLRTCRGKPLLGLRAGVGQAASYGRPKKVEVPQSLSKSEDPDNVIPTLTRISRLLGNKHKVQFPRVVVIGNQSSGKSSVLEAIVGEDFLPKGRNMVTCRPLELTLVRTDSGRWAQFADGRKVYDFAAVQQRILEENQDVEISDDPIHLEIHSPHVHNVSLVDLPGYIHAIKKGQSKDLPKKIDKLCEKYITNGVNMILAVVSATEDTAMSMGVTKAQAVDEDGDRTMGVITKLDLVKSLRSVVTTLKNEEYPLGLGYIGVRCRNQKELEAGVDFTELIDVEEAFLKKAKLRRYEGVKLGIPTLRTELSKELLHRISGDLAGIIAELDTKIEKAKRDEEFLTVMARETDLTNVARELEKLVNQFHPTSASRLSFEKKSRARLRETIADAWTDGVFQNYNFDPKELEVSSSEAKAMFKPESGDKRVRKLSGGVLHELGFSSAGSSLDMDRFQRMMVFGEGTPDKIDDKMLRDLNQDVLTTGCLAPYYMHVLSEDHQAQRLKWQRRLEDTVVTVVDDGLVDKCREQMVEDLLTFVENIDHGKREESKMAKFFFKYLIEKISTQMDAEGLSNGLTSMMNREKRAVADYFDFVHATQELLHAPDVHSWGVFSKDEFPLVVPAYGEVWTKAYFNIVIKRSTNDVFRSLAVELLNPMIFQSINYSLNMFKSGKVFREARAQLKWVNELKQHRDVLAKAEAHYRTRPKQQTMDFEYSQES